MSENEEPGYTAPDVSLVGDAHAERYAETGGDIGYMWNGVPTLLLTTTGHRSGKERTVPLIFGRDGEDLLVIASKGGAPEHPNWYRNLSAEPRVTVQVKSDQMSATARTAGPDERDRLWSIMTDQWPNYDVYTTRTTREIPLVVITPD